MNIQLDPSFLQQNGSSQAAVKKLERAEQRDTFKSQLSEKIGNSTPQRKDEKLWDTCVEFESVFVGKLFDAMRKTVPKGEIMHGGHAEEIFEDFLYDEYAKITSKHSNIGIASMLYEQLG